MRSALETVFSATSLFKEISIMATKYHYPAITADAFVFCEHNNSLYLLLVKRKNPPFQNCWAVPGGFMDEEEPIVDCAARELDEETGLSNIRLTEFAVFSTPGRDPRGRVITIGFISVLKGTLPGVTGGDDAAEAKWFQTNHLPELAFDHKECVTSAFCFLKERDRLGDPERIFPPAFNHKRIYF